MAKKCAREWELDTTLFSMNKERTGKMIERLQDLSPDLIQSLKSKVKYVVSHSNREYKLIGQYMMPQDQHDGLVPLRSQSLGHFGEKTAPNLALQRAFSRTLFSALTQP